MIATSLLKPRPYIQPFPNRKDVAKIVRELDRYRTPDFAIRLT
jgi:hypothetical protein